MTVEHRFRVMNTDALIIAHPDRRRREDVATRLAAAEELARATERTFSRFMPSSELCQLNTAAGSWVDVSREMSEVLELAYGLHAQTGGLFDPGILPELEHAGYDRTFGDLPADRDAAGPAPRREARFGDIGFAPGRARLPEGLRIDLGGIVKGWTADLLADRLADVGPCLVELGGDTAVRGSPPDSDGWDIGLQKPGSEGELLAVVRLAEGGVATSGTDARRWKRGGEWAHHLIDPRTGTSSGSELTQVTAFAPGTAFAEVWAKAAVIAGTDEAARMLGSHPEIQFVLVRSSGETVASAGVPFAYGPPVRA